MSMIPGNVSVDDSGNETYTPNNVANAAKALYLLLLADQATNTVPSTTVTAPVVTIDPVTFEPTIVTPGSVTITNVPVPITADAKKAQAKLANTLASWMVTYIQINATVTGQVDNNNQIVNGQVQ